MNKLLLSQEAQNDLFAIKAYIVSELENPGAAVTTIAEITKCLHQLTQFAALGAPLSSVADVQSDYRFLVCGKYLAFYRVQASNVYIDRVLYGRRDYLRILFDKQLEEAEK